MTIRSSLLAVLATLLAMPAAQAQQAGDWLWRVGIHNMRPKSDNHPLVNADAAASLTVSATYLLTPQWAVEMLAGLPFSHDIRLNAGGKVGRTRQLPPTLSLQYHFNPTGTLRPFIGAGLNYTLFLSERTRGALAGSSLKLQDSWGVAAQVGVDLRLNDDWFATIDGRWLDIDTRAQVDGRSIGTVELDPYAFGLSVGRRF